MKKLILGLFILNSCTPEPIDLSEQAKKEIISTDREMSSLALEKGFHHALLVYADDDAIKPNEGELPVVGKQNLEKYWMGKKDTRQISWEPFRAEASFSGDMGYTVGYWKLVTADSSFYGNYYTFWKRQPDGKWKFVFDGGNGTPVPGK